MSVRTFIVDDTRLARQEMGTLLTAHADVHVVGEADDVPAACSMIETLRPDLVMLDIQMPSGTGFDVLDSLSYAPFVIFTTAYDQFALKAFELNALDYLVKPVVPERLANALSRVRERLEKRLSDPAKPSAVLGINDHVFLRDGELCWFVALAEISHIVVDGNFAAVHFRNQKAMLTRSLSTLEARLDPALFFRANRKTLVNLSMIKAIDLAVGDGYELTLKNSSIVEVSRRQARELRERLAL